MKDTKGPTRVGVTLYKNSTSGGIYTSDWLDYCPSGRTCETREVPIN